MESTIAPPPALGRLLNIAAGAGNRLAQALLDEHGLQLGHWVILSALWRRDGLLVSELARYSGNSVPAASRIIDRMIEKGLVTRQGDPKDRRVARIRLTAAGAALAPLQNFHVEMNSRLLEGFTPDEAACLQALLERVVANGQAALAGLGSERSDEADAR